MIEKSGLPVISHFVRSWLKMTETFIYHQVAKIRKFDSIVITRKRKNRDHFPFPHIYSSQDELAFMKKYYSNTAYKSLRVLTRFERNRFVEILKKNRIRLLHGHYGTDSMFIWPVAKALHIPLVTSFYGYDASRFLKGYMGMGRLYIKRLLKLGDIFIVPSIYMKKCLMDVGGNGNRIEVIPWGIDLEHFSYKERCHGTDSQKVHFVCISGFTKKKGLGYLVDAFLELTKKINNVRLTLVGDGPEFHKINQVVKMNGLERNVDMPGLIPNNMLADLLYEADVYVQPSITTSKGDQEGIPTTIMEAFATGLPVISTHHAGIPEIVKEGTNGFLVPERDIQGLANKMMKLAGNYNLRSKMAREGRRCVENDFSIDKQVKRLENIYEDVLNSVEIEK